VLVKIKDIKYRDVSLSFASHPNTGDLITVINEQSVIQSIKTLVLLQIKDLYQQDKGSDVLSYLFSPIDTITAVQIQYEIERVIKKYEIRIDQDTLVVTVKPDEDNNRFLVNIEFIIIDRITPTIVSIFLEKVR
jgi:phage baseplate assembly protein W